MKTCVVEDIKKEEFTSCTSARRMEEPQGYIDEQALVERLKNGDEYAVNQIVEKYKNPLFAFILRIVDNHALAEDIFQETWLSMIRHIRGFRGDSLFSTWLFQIALNQSRNALKKVKRRDFVPLEYVESVADEPIVNAEEILKAEQVRALITGLPIKMREVIVLRFYHDLSEKEISGIVGAPVGTVKSRLHRASGILRKKIEAGY